MQQSNAPATEQAGRGNRYISIPDGKGGRTRISLDPKAVTIDNQAADAATIASDQARADIPRGVVDIVQAIGAMIVLVVVGGPLARAFARRIDRRTVAAPAALPPEVAQRLAAIERAVDSVAVEVERISEGQRFTTKLLSDRTKVEVGGAS